jgi:hypothetical protein
MSKKHISRENKSDASGWNNAPGAAPLDPRLVVIARAIGRLVAREQLNAEKAERNS